MMIFILAYLSLVIFYFFRVMKSERNEIAEKIVKEVDNHNLETLKEFSERKISPIEYNRQIKNYKREVSNALLSRAITYPFSLILKLFKKLLYKNK